jgi:ribosomal protein S18 acetylase RimI-like enzyme
MTPQNQEIVDQFWEHEMNAARGWHQSGPRVQFTEQHLYSGVQLCQRDGRVVVACPPQHLESVKRRLEGQTAERLFFPESVRRLLMPDVRELVGPAQVGYADESSFLPAPGGVSRTLIPEDDAQHQELASALSVGELAQRGCDWRQTPAFGVFEDGVLCAVANYEVWYGEIAHITVATHPHYRHRGWGRAVVTELAEHALARNLILQYRVLASNEASLRLGRALGFEFDVTTLYARMG